MQFYPLMLNVYKNVWILFPGMQEISLSLSAVSRVQILNYLVEKVILCKIGNISDSFQSSFPVIHKVGNVAIFVLL